MSDDDTNPTGVVGYQKPPKNSQFKPGQSGNPKGRPKKPKETSFLDDAATALAEKISIIQNGKTIKLTKREFAAKTLVNNALKKDPRALDLLVKYLKTWEKESRKGKKQEPKAQFKWANWEQINGKWELVVENERIEC